MTLAEAIAQARDTVEWSCDLDLTEREAISIVCDAVCALRNCYSLARRKHRLSEDKSAWGHIIRFCEEAGLRPNILRDKRFLLSSLSAADMYPKDYEQQPIPLPPPLQGKDCNSDSGSHYVHAGASHCACKLFVRVIHTKGLQTKPLPAGGSCEHGKRNHCL